jgi:hypothetical protein
MHGKLPERHGIRHVRRFILWGIVIPSMILILAWPTHGMSLLMSFFYPLQVAWNARCHRKAGMPHLDAWLYGASIVVGRFPNTVGAVRYWYGQLVGRCQALIEYK